MKTMKMAFLPCLIGSLIMSVLTSCSTTDLYYQPLTQRPSIPWKHSSSSWGGYIESQKNNTITIRYEAYNQPTAEVALYFTELRAAERALIDGKRHFYLVQPPTLNSTPEQSYFPPTRSPAISKPNVIKFMTGAVRREKKSTNAGSAERYGTPRCMCLKNS